MNHATPRTTLEQQRRITQHKKKSDNWTFFNLLTSDALLATVEALLPEHRERMFPPTETLSMYLAHVMSADRSCQRAVDQAAISRLLGALPVCSSHTGDVSVLTRMATRSSVRDGAWPCYAFLGRLVQYICTNTTVGASMQTINISDFRANLLKYLEIANSGEIISITSNGRLLATITPPAQLKDQAKRQLKALAAKAKVHDVTSPIDESWEAMS